MHRSFLIATVALLLALPSSLRAQQPIKIGVVDMAKIFDSYYKTQQERQIFEEHKTDYEKKMRDLSMEVDKKRDDLKKLSEEADNPVFSEDKRTEKRKLFESKRAEYQLFMQDASTQHDKLYKMLGEEFETKKKSLADEIIKVVQDKAKKDAYTLILDKSGLSTNLIPPFVYSQDSLDITQEIITLINAGAPAVKPAAPSTAAPATPAAKPADKKP